MNHDVRRRLREISEAREQEYGKLVQKLLAIAFCDAGAARVTDRGIQGIDLEVEFADGRQAALEVKTSQSQKVSFGKKDIGGLEGRAAQGYTPYFALLGPRVVDDWIFARCPAGEIRADVSYALTYLRAYRDAQLEQVVRGRFAAAVVEHASAAIEGGQGALDAVLRGYGCYAPA